MSLQRYILDLSQFNLNFNDVLKEIIQKNSNFILGLVRTRLYNYGIDGSGGPILPDYKPSTIRSKKERGQRTSHVTLRDTGLFYKGFYLELTDGYVLKLDSTDFKTVHLIDKYGASILEFTEQEKLIIMDTIIEPGLIRKINTLAFNSSSAGGISIL